MSLRARKINRIVFIVFLSASAYALAKALLPGDDSVGFIPWDKAKHFIVFYVLSVLASLALPQSRLHRIGLVLLAFGGSIEILQGFVGRDASWFDLFADACGISAAFGPMLVSKWWRETARF
ncbi:VanZ family protein [Caulobacter soli]|uniref:VanZ family protein n=1 Tax=Caulobacter soli TaxID=2708539 RepID=UPI0013E9EA33|nr:VanZ family protein [Caulobacter soli]